MDVLEAMEVLRESILSGVRKLLEPLEGRKYGNFYISDDDELMYLDVDYGYGTLGYRNKSIYLDDLSLSELIKITDELWWN